MDKKEMLYLRCTKRNLLLAVDLYDDILPWCQRSEIVRRNPDGSFDAELEIGFRFLVESYISHVVLDKPKFIRWHQCSSGRWYLDWSVRLLINADCYMVQGQSSSKGFSSSLECSCIK
ncbi:coenzyme Q-binding protein COQ10, mitochondrial-like isoform X2 [Chenopodium quinoa]|uniref:coenzyme Q-binding protein COQ10, mitochondrial-like isoform X2 n=1 Tax=Chenopodium quinoa TaxID=63459 RepID=UPI000B79AB08|nr:coenzyme Q-binding protein COQ10, mitochondrial-like isoform X2 [Chenopodium quinoa]